MKIIRKRERIEETHYDLYFEWRDCKGAGFGFDCDKDGKVDLSKLNSGARENYEKCISGEYDVEPHGVRELNHSYMQEAIGKCDCGEEVHLTAFTNTCDGCGADYNFGGQKLAPRSQWGEETGEHWTECY